MLILQKTDRDRERAIDILKSLVNKNAAKPNDQLQLAELYEISGNWEKAREVYLSLNSRTKGTHDQETLNVRLESLVRFARKCLSRSRSGAAKRRCPMCKTSSTISSRFSPTHLRLSSFRWSCTGLAINWTRSWN